MDNSSLVRIALLGALALAILPSLAGAQSVMQTICGGSATANGIIAPSPLLGAGTQGAASVVGLTLIIMLTVLLVTAMLYMVSQIAGLPSLGNFVKVELAEMVGTCLLIALFFGAFYAASFAAAGGQQAATTNPALHFNGPGRAVFVNDCATLGSSSLAIVEPVIITGTVNYFLNTLDTLTFKITPGGFGFSDSPLSGLAIIPTTLNELQGIMAAFLVAVLAIMFLLGFIYSLFPLFLYIGIVLRAFPWSRAAGGVFIAIFIGFYIVFPIMLNDTVGGLGAAFAQNNANYYASGSATGTANALSATGIASVQPTQNGGPAATGGTMSYLGDVLGSIVGWPGGYGVINGFIADFMGPAIMLVVMIALSLVVALDFADILSDILGAPSLSTERLLGKIL
jgi:hypothetical protein